MPNAGAYLVSDLPPAQLCRIACRKCDRRGAYRRDTLAARFGVDAAPPDVLGEALEAPVFVSNKGGALDPSQAHRIVAAAAMRAGIKGNVSAHWLRHAHASHALDRGAPPHLVQSTLGHASLSTTSRYLHARPGDSSARYLAV